MKDFWNERYGTQDFAYGKAPNQGLKEFLSAQQPVQKPITHSTKDKSILFLAEGEGRNSVYAATLGYHVIAIDYSDEGRQKTMKLATEMGVEDLIEYFVMDLTSEDTFAWIQELAKNPERGTQNEPNIHDGNGVPRGFIGAVFCFTHLPVDVCNSLYHACASILDPNGWFFIEGFGKDQLQYQSGGPKNEELLFDEDDLRGVLEPLFEKVVVLSGNKILDEGPFHQGEGHLVTVHAHGVKQ